MSNNTQQQAPAQTKSMTGTAKQTPEQVAAQKEENARILAAVRKDWVSRQQTVKKMTSGIMFTDRGA